MAWSHDPNIYEDYENLPMDILVTFIPPSGSVVSYAVSYDSGNGVFECTASAAGIQCNHLAILGNYLEGLYPISDVKWITERSGTIFSGDKFTDVPFEAFMQSLRPHPENIKEFDITCTCNWIDSNAAPQVEVKILKIIIWQHYDKNTETFKTLVGESNVPAS